MRFETKPLIDELLAIADHAAESAKKFKTLDTKQLNFRQHNNSWSILQCIEHLNLYGDFYLPEIAKQIDAGKFTRHTSTYKSGIIGNYFANLMRGKNGKIKKLKSPKDKTPVSSTLLSITLDRFLKQLDRLKALLIESQNVDMTKTKVPISISRIIKINLGDTFRFYTYHIERHIAQANRVMKLAVNQKNPVAVP